MDAVDRKTPIGILYLRTYTNIYAQTSEIDQHMEMDTISETVIQHLANFGDEVSKLEGQYNAKVKSIHADYREKMESLLKERQGHIGEADGFWCGVLAAAESPLTPLLNGTTDPKILRAVTHFSVESSVREGELYRKVVFKFRPNMFVESTEVHREIDSRFTTTSMSAISWKQGTETARKDSVFRFFSEDVQIQEVGETLEALDASFLSPFLALECSTA